MKNIKLLFPFFQNNSDSIYFDNASTTQKPYVVLNTLYEFYAQHNANVHRGIYRIAEHVTEKYETARKNVASFLNVATEEIIFTHGATDAFNRIAISWGYANIQEGDEILVTELEHHANFVPWYQLCKEKKAILKVVPVLHDGTLDYTSLDRFITKKTKLVAVTHVSNAIGTEVDLALIITKAKNVGAKVLVDGCQAAPYKKLDLAALDCDFYIFSGHKMMSPVGVGVLYIKNSVQKECVSFPTGGGSVQEVSLQLVTFAKAPHCFEPGTLSVADVVALDAAITFINNYGLNAIQEHCNFLTKIAIQGLESMEHIRVLGPIQQLKTNGHLVSFVVKDVHAHDVAAILDTYNIAVRAGHHCAQPLAKALDYTASVRASFYVYNTQEEVALFLNILKTLA